MSRMSLRADPPHHRILEVGARLLQAGRQHQVDKSPKGRVCPPSSVTGARRMLAALKNSGDHLLSAGHLSMHPVRTTGRLALR